MAVVSWHVALISAFLEIASEREISRRRWRRRLAQCLSALLGVCRAQTVWNFVDFTWDHFHERSERGFSLPTRRGSLDTASARCVLPPFHPKLRRPVCAATRMPRAEREFRRQKLCAVRAFRSCG